MMFGSNIGIFHWLQTLMATFSWVTVKFFRIWIIKFYFCNAMQLSSSGAKNDIFIFDINNPTHLFNILYLPKYFPCCNYYFCPTFSGTCFEMTALNVDFKSLNVLYIFFICLFDRIPEFFLRWINNEVIIFWIFRLVMFQIFPFSNDDVINFIFFFLKV